MSGNTAFAVDILRGGHYGAGCTTGDGRWIMSERVGNGRPQNRGGKTRAEHEEAAAHAVFRDAAAARAAFRDAMADTTRSSSGPSAASAAASAATSAASAAAGKAFRRLQSRGGQLLHWFPELSKTLLGEGDLEAVLSQINGLRTEVRRRAGATGRDLEARAERILGELERQAVQRLQPLLNRAHVASQNETGALDERVAHLESRIGTLLEDRAMLTGRVSDLESQLRETRVELGERVREVDMRLTATDDLRGDLADLRHQLDTLAKDHVARSLELGKLQDRILRMEMRFGDLLKEHSAHLADHEDVKKRLGELATVIENATRLARSAADQATEATTLARGAADRVAAFTVEHARERSEIEQMDTRGADIERVVRQLELRVGDLGERHSGVREDLATLGARMAQLELTAAPAPAPSSGPERSEGH
jgi:chromosome segregation ATPase